MSAAERLRVLPRLTRVAVGAARDRVHPARPADASVVPGTTAALTTDWLTDALCGNHPPARVTAVRVKGGSDGTSCRRALELTYSGLDGQTQDRPPSRVFTKMAASFSSRALLGVTGITMGESIFYNEIRPLVTLRSPRAHFASADPDSCRSIVIMEDLADQGYSFPDPMRDAISHADALDMIEQMAAYHGAFWNGGQAASALHKLPTALGFQLPLNERAGFAKRFERGLTRSAEHVPAALMARRRELWPAIMRSLELNASGPETLLHQDVHQGNWLRDPAGRMGLYDWQCVARGSWALDVAYALAQVLDTADRREWELELVSRYVDLLGEHGASDPPTPEAAWEKIREQPMHAFGFAVFTNGQSRFQPELQPFDYTIRSIERIAAAVEDWDTLSLLR